jgi:hypothetical protein
MSSIFDIQQDLTSIFEELEENGGELTEELYEKLNISQEEFKSKVEAYINVIKSAKNDIELCKQENKRLRDRQKVKENLIDRLSSIVISAIQQFGDESKTGTKFLDYGTGRVSIKNTEAVELNLLNGQICNDAIAALRYKFENKQLEGYNSVDCQEIINDVINTSRSEDIDFRQPLLNDELTVEDICALDTKITFTVNLGDLMQGEGFEFIRHFLKYADDYKIEDGTTKTKFKELYKNDDLHVGKIVNNKSLLIK